VKGVNMQKVIKQILEVIGDYEGSKLTFTIWPPDEIYFYIYETEIPVVINVKEKYAYVDSETMTNHLTGDMLYELSHIVKIIESNMDDILYCLK
jgi:hypothetical protein